MTSSNARSKEGTTDSATAATVIDTKPGSPSSLPERIAAWVRTWPASRRRLAIGLGAIGIVLLIVWLASPSANGAFSIAAETGVVTIEPLCADELIWDLPAGRVLLQSSEPGQSTIHEGATTLTLRPGARARIVSTEPGRLTIAVTPSATRAAVCASRARTNASADPFYDVSINGAASLTHDPLGVTYGTPREAQPSGVAEHAALEVRGRVTIGEVVQTGAGWRARVTPMLESGSLDLRVVPWLAGDRVTLRTERLEAGSLFDTHACLDVTSETTPCPGGDADSAIGFLRLREGGGIGVQLFAQGRVGTQSLGGDQYAIEIPQGAAVWQSPLLRAMFSVLLGVFAVYQGTKTVLKDLIGWWRGKPLAIVICIVVGVGAASAEPVEVRQGSLVGAGFSFRRGASCFVVTARHVVPQPGLAVSVFDRTGAKAEATRAYDNESYDLALLSLPEKSAVACTTTWPDAAWIARTSFTARNEFRAVRHYANGRETIVRLQHAGGIKHLLSLAPLDRLTVRESDSGAIVELEGRLVGIVQSVDAETDRVNVLRFDTIDSLVGDRFRGSSAGPVRLVNVALRGRSNPAYGTYVQSWLTEKAGRTVLPATAARNSGPAACSIGIDVLAWDRVSIENPAYEAVELQLRACGRRDFLSQQVCSAGRAAQRSTPRRVLSHKLTINTTVTPPDGPPVSKLETTSHVPPASPPLGRTELELWVVQAAVGPTLQELMNRAPCR